MTNGAETDHQSCIPQNYARNPAANPLDLACREAVTPTAPKPFRLRPAPEPQALDLERGSARERGYTPAWDRAAAAHRAEHPLCVYCAKGVFGPRRDTPTQCVDHLYPHRRYPGVFWLTVYWIASCDDCHDGPKQQVEHQGREALDRLARRLGLAPLAAG